MKQQCEPGVFLICSEFLFAGASALSSLKLNDPSRGSQLYPLFLPTSLQQCTMLLDTSVLFPVKLAQQSLDDEDSNTTALSAKANETQVVSSVILCRPECMGNMRSIWAIWKKSGQKIYS